MATSGSTNFSVDRDTIITEALEHIGVLAEGDSPTAAQLTSCARTLNMMVKSWQTDNLHLHTIKKAYLFLAKNTHEYSLSSSGDNYTYSYVKTQIATAGSSGDSIIYVDSITGISNADYIGIELDDGTLQWTTVNGAPSGSTIPLTASLTDDVAVDNYVFAYTTKADRPMDIVKASVRNTSNVDVAVNNILRSEYVELSNKTTDGQVSQVWYDRHVGTGTLRTWPETDDVTNVLVLWVKRTIEDFDTSTDEIDMPQEAYLAVVFNLAALLGYKYGTPTAILDRISAKAMGLKDTLEGYDREDSVMFSPDYRN